jgi:hypothetical protein
MGLAHSDQVAALDSVSLRDGETVPSAVLQRQLPYAERLSVANMAQIEAVMLRGQFLDRTRLNSMLDEVVAEARR